MPAREPISRAGCRITLSDGNRAGRNVGRELTAAGALPEPAVSAVLGKAGYHEVAQPAQAGEGLGLRAAGHSQTLYLHNGARDHGGLGIVTEAEPVAHAGGDGDDVFKGASQLNSQNIGAAVNAE